MEPKRAQWGSKIGFILAAAGSAVGLGNIWKFPGKAYEGGGGAYILIYLAIVLLIGIPVMLSELTIGRGAQANAIDSYGKLGHPGYKWVGWFGVIVAFIITSYYCHVGGWPATPPSPQRFTPIRWDISMRCWATMPSPGKHGSH